MADKIKVLTAKYLLPQNIFVANLFLIGKNKYKNTFLDDMFCCQKVFTNDFILDGNKFWQKHSHFLGKSISQGEIKNFSLNTITKEV